MKKRYIEDQKKKLTAGVIDRRKFVMSALAAGVVLPSALSMAGKAMAATPKSGGLFKMASQYGSTTDVLDPAAASNGFSVLNLFTRGNCLTEVSDTGELIGELAESFEPSDNATKWVFNLRKGIEFHNGKSLTPEDVIATLNHHRSEDSTSGGKGLLGNIKDIRKDGDMQVVFELESGSADFPFIMSDYHFMIMASEGDNVADPNSKNGTGAYVLDSFEAGVRSNFTRNPNYWKEGRAHFDAVELISVLDKAARQNAIMNGDVDYADGVDPKTVALLKRVPTLEILEVTGTQHYTFPMRMDAAPFDNYDLRMALKFAINRQELVDKILLGHGVAGNDVPVNAAMPFFNTELPVHEYDIERATMHYKKSGHSGTIQLSASDAAFAGSVDAAQLMAASAKKAGIDIEVVREPADGYWSNVWNKKPWCACYWNGRPTQDWMFSSGYIAESEWNDTAWRTTDSAKRFNEVVVEARSETDQEARKNLYWEAQSLLQDDGGAIVAMWANYISANNKSLKHSENIAANLDNDGDKVAERWWKA